MELSDPAFAHAELLRLEDCLWIYNAPTGIGNYDFEFSRFFRCQHRWRPQGDTVAVARVGAVSHNDVVYDTLRDHEQIALIHTPEEHLRASELPRWYPLIAHLKPRSLWFETRPPAKVIEEHFGWPIFMKGSRQTSRHQRTLSIIASAEQFEQALNAYAADPILRWQGVVCRDYVPLRHIEDANPNRLPCAFEFRTFWWKCELAGCGRYWWEAKQYRMTALEERDALAVAREAAERVDVSFLVVDVAQAQDGRWLVIECNDGQESGYAGIPAMAIWQRIVDIERNRHVRDAAAT
jgi:hypothetical protein